MPTVIDPHPTPLVEAVEANLVEHVSFVQRQLEGMEVRAGDGLVLVDSGLESDTFNKILGARLEPSTADARIDEAVSRFQEARRPFTWWVGPCSRPLDIEDRLRRRGLSAIEQETGMTIELGSLPGTATPRGASIRRVTTEAELSAFSRLLAFLADPPDLAVIAFFDRARALLMQADCPMRLFLATVEGEPAAVSGLFVGGGVAGVHMVATAARFRRRGLGLALTWTALEHARRAWPALTIGALQASEQGRPVYERLGFEPCGQFVEYTPGACS